MMRYPFHIISSDGLGIRYSSLEAIGDFYPTRGLGQAQVQVYFNVGPINNYVIEDRVLDPVERFGRLRLGFIFNYRAEDPKQAWRFRLKRMKTVPANPLSGPKIVLIEEDGHETTYLQNPASQNLHYYYAKGVKNGVAYFWFDEAFNRWIGYDPVNNMTEVYDLNGTLLSRQNQYGQTLRFQYYPDGSFHKLIVDDNNYYQLLNLTSSTGYQMELAMVRGGTSTTLQSYQFDLNQRLLVSESPSGYQICYRYPDDTGLDIDSIEQDDGSYLHITQPTEHQFAYLNIGKGPTYYCRFQYDGNRVTINTAVMALNLSLTLDNEARIIQSARGLGTTSQALAELRTYEYVNGLQLASIGYDDGTKTCFAYSYLLNLLIRRVDRDGYCTQWIYDNNSPLPPNSNL